MAIPPFAGPPAPKGVLISRKFAFAWNTPNIATGAPIGYTPAVGDIIHSVSLVIETPWTVGHVSLGDIGIFTGGNTVGIFGNLISPVDMTAGSPVTQPGTLEAVAYGADASAALLFSSLYETGAGANPVGFQVVPGSTFNSESFPFVVTTANPLSVVVSQDGTTTGGASTAIAGAATLYLVTASPQ